MLHPRPVLSVLLLFFIVVLFFFFVCVWFAAAVCFSPPLLERHTLKKNRKTQRLRRKKKGCAEPTRRDDSTRIGHACASVWVRVREKESVGEGNEKTNTDVQESSRRANQKKRSKRKYAIQRHYTLKEEEGEGEGGRRTRQRLSKPNQ